MEKSDQVRIVHECIENLQQYLLSRMDRVPPDWDGLELRQWVIDTAKDQLHVEMSRSRLHDYRNAVLVNNL